MRKHIQMLKVVRLTLIALVSMQASGCTTTQHQRRDTLPATGQALVIQLPGLEGAENRRKIDTAIESQWHRSSGARGGVQVLTPSASGLLERVRSGLLLARQHTEAPHGSGCNSGIPDTLARLQEVDHARAQGEAGKARDLLQQTERELSCQNKVVTPQLLAGMLLMQGLLEPDDSALAQAMELDPGLYERMAAYPLIQRRLEAARQRMDSLPIIPVALPELGTTLRLYLDGSWVEESPYQLNGRFHVVQWVDDQGVVLFGQSIRLSARESKEPQALLPPAELPPSLDDARRALLEALQERALPGPLRVSLQYVLHRGTHPWILVVGPSTPPKERWALPGTFKSIDVVPTNELKLHVDPRQRPSARR